MAKQFTLVLLKPDAIKRGLALEILKRFKNNDLEIRAWKGGKFTKQWIEGHYEEHRGKHFFDRNVAHMISGDITVIVLEGENAIQKVRDLVGPTFNAPQGTIRGDYGTEEERTLVHASDSVQSANREIIYWWTDYFGSRLSDILNDGEE
jgi:nucleoside-diphosphate kinase